MARPVYTPAPDAPYALLREMAAAPALIAQFDAARTGNFRARVLQKSRLLVTGEGSSRLFPAGNLIDRARRTNAALAVTAEGARQAMEYAPGDTTVIGLSNSGRTRETAHALEFFRRQNITTLAITGAADSPVAQQADDSITLSCGAEQAVAASKSVVEQALLLHALLDGDMARQADAAAAAAQILAAPVAEKTAAALAGADTVYIAGRHTGVAAEIALKTCEITRQRAVYLDGTTILHGIEEVMRPTDCVILVEPFAAETARYQSVLQQGVGLPVIALSAAATPFDTIRLPVIDGFDNYLQLMAGWSLLAAAGQMRGVDLDKTERARKVGNAIG